MWMPMQWYMIYAHTNMHMLLISTQQYPHTHTSIEKSISECVTFLQSTSALALWMPREWRRCEKYSWPQVYIPKRKRITCLWCSVQSATRLPTTLSSMGTIALRLLMTLRSMLYQHWFEACADSGYAGLHLFGLATSLRGRSPMLGHTPQGDTTSRFRTNKLEILALLTTLLTNQYLCFSLWICWTLLASITLTQAVHI